MYWTQSWKVLTFNLILNKKIFDGWVSKMEFKMEANGINPIKSATEDSHPQNINITNPHNFLKELLSISLSTLNMKSIHKYKCLQIPSYCQPLLFITIIRHMYISKFICTHIHTSHIVVSTLLFVSPAVFIYWTSRTLQHFNSLNNFLSHPWIWLKLHKFCN